MKQQFPDVEQQGSRGQWTVREGKPWGEPRDASSFLPGETFWPKHYGKSPREEPQAENTVLRRWRATKTRIPGGSATEDRLWKPLLREKAAESRREVSWGLPMNTKWHATG